MSKAILAIVVIMLAGCAASTAVHTADGTKKYSLDCSGIALDWDHCQQKARQLCGTNGYNVLQKNEDQSPMMADDRSGLFAGWQNTHRTMVVSCKTSS